jgi:hypothetical protein
MWPDLVVTRRAGRATRARLGAGFAAISAMGAIRGTVDDYNAGPRAGVAGLPEMLDIPRAETTSTMAAGWHGQGSPIPLCRSVDAGARPSRARWQARGTIATLHAPGPPIAGLRDYDGPRVDQRRTEQ